METLAFASQLMTVLYNEVAPFTNTSLLPLHSPALPTPPTIKKTQPGEKKIKQGE